MNHILQYFLRHIKPERRRIADIELDNVMPFLLHAARALEHRTTNVVTHIGEFAGFRNWPHAGCIVELKNDESVFGF